MISNQSFGRYILQPFSGIKSEELGNHYTSWGTHNCYVIYKALCFDVAQGRMNGAPNETRTHSCRSASLAC